LYTATNISKLQSDKTHCSSYRASIYHARASNLPETVSIGLPTLRP
jgi:hypothetical protein